MAYFLIRTKHDALQLRCLLVMVVVVVVRVRVAVHPAQVADVTHHGATATERCARRATSDGRTGTEAASTAASHAMMAHRSTDRLLVYGRYRGGGTLPRLRLLRDRRQRRLVAHVDVVVLVVMLREHDDRLLFSTIGFPPLDSLLMRFGGGDGVEMRFACCSGMISAPGPTRLSRIGKKNSPFTAPITFADSSSQKKWLTTNSNEDVESMRMASADVTTPCTIGANECSSDSFTRRSRLPIEVMKPCVEKRR
uniref:Uncharacterized protein n=1 Tax=Anopheles farauti TaxID=69004 RepID=A0A182QPW9_9DIPT